MSLMGSSADTSSPALNRLIPREAPAMSTGPGELIARCDNVTEDEVGTPCPGRLHFRWGMGQAACDTCGAYCGIAVATWERVEPSTEAAEGLAWERDVALSRVAAAEAVQGRMADSLPDSGPWESWSERDRAVRDYEGDLSAALAVETDIVAERLREVERERDEARAVLVGLRRGLADALRIEHDDARPTAGLVQRVRNVRTERDGARLTRDEARAELSRRDAAIAAVREVCDETERRAHEMVGMFSGRRGVDLPAWVGRVRAALSAPVEADATEPATDREVFALREAAAQARWNINHIEGGSPSLDFQRHWRGTAVWLEKRAAAIERGETPDRGWRPDVAEAGAPDEPTGDTEREAQS